MLANGTRVESRGACPWYWQYSTMFDVILGIASGLACIGVMFRAFALYKKWVMLAHHALVFSFIVVGCGCLLLAATPLSLDGIYAFGGPTATFVQSWVCWMVLAVAVQLFALSWKLHKTDRLLSQFLMVSLCISVGIAGMAIGIRCAPSPLLYPFFFVTFRRSHKFQYTRVLSGAVLSIT